MKWVGRALVILILSAVATTSFAQDATLRDIRRRINDPVVRILTGNALGTTSDIAGDLIAVLSSDRLRIVPVAGQGSLQSLTDLLYLKGIDIALIQADVLNHLREQRVHRGLERRITYLAQLFAEEVHLLARADIGGIEDLAGQKVNLGLPNSGSDITAAKIFNSLQVGVSPVYEDPGLALERLKRGEIAAMFFIAGQPNRFLQRVGPDSGLHLVEVPYRADYDEVYQPAALSAATYPALLGADETIETVAVPVTMIAFNWKPDTSRFATVARFTNALFDGIAALQQAPRHPKWQEIDLRAELRGWDRFEGASTWLAAHDVGGGTGGPAYSDADLTIAFDEFLTTRFPGMAQSMTAEQRAALLEQFRIWLNQNPQ
jgi:TRAP transporter TAXI family solute receptor